MKGSEILTGITISITVIYTYFRWYLQQPSIKMSNIKYTFILKGNNWVTEYIYFLKVIISCWQNWDYDQISKYFMYNTLCITENCLLRWIFNLLEDNKYISVWVESFPLEYHYENLHTDPCFNRALLIRWQGNPLKAKSCTTQDLSANHRVAVFSINSALLAYDYMIQHFWIFSK